MLDSDRVEQVGMALEWQLKVNCSDDSVEQAYVNIYPYREWIKKTMLDNWNYEGVI